MPDELKALAKSLFLYNQAANAYFAKPEAVDLSTLTGSYEAKDGDTLTGTLGGNYQISVAAGATVTLKDASIGTNYRYDSNTPFAGITLLGDAAIIRISLGRELP